MDYSYWMWGGGLWMGLWMLLGVVAVVVIVWLVVRVLQGVGTSQTPPREPAPEELLRARFARGEIDEEEFRRRLAVLREGR